MTDTLRPKPANPANPQADLAPLAELAGITTPPARASDGRFLTGNGGGGRPKGSRNRLTDVFLSAVADDFAEHGAAAIARIREADPAAYVRIVGSLVPRELIVQREREPVLDLDTITREEFQEVYQQARHRQFLRETLEKAEPLGAYDREKVRR
ncbi:hypothetical protein [Phenylobacterium sp.]|uniref:hypothetical protein n=1 Tax=Phenylobacterium sp. TaxID=1871053 RepID=UPI00273414C6|nr:hypothetical protein [Phenylobacterium sp.]MDP3659220.1 hypothetical protein [Phenylobacterium sp.]